jgi:cytidine deaminase
MNIADQWPLLSQAAWERRRNAHILGKTRVGAAALAGDGTIFGGCNIEHKYRCHDIHAEVSAIAGMVSSGHSDLCAILIAAERELFTPCGGCLDWIFQFGGAACLVAHQASPDGEIKVWQAGELMPFYPR